MAVPKLPHRRLLDQGGAAPLDGILDGAHKHVTGQWLRQELDCSRLHGPDRHRHIAVARDEDDGHVNPVRSDALLQFETIKVRKTQVEYQAARGSDPWAVQKLLRGRECLWLPACGVDQQFQRLAHRDVVVNDEYDRRGVQHDNTSMHSRAIDRPGAITSFCYRRPRIQSGRILGMAMADHPRRSIVAAVDDDQRILESLEMLLESADYEVRLFSSAHGAAGEWWPRGKLTS